MKEYGDKVPAEIKTKIEEKVTSLRESINNSDVEGMKAGIEALNQVTFPCLLIVYAGHF